MVDFTPPNTPELEQPNPLQKYFRQPKVYITLPSNGKYYYNNGIDFPENGELPVYPMTAKDELAMKTPDALLNGQATVDVIQSCVPNIKNAWEMPSIDLDAVLIAIRIATYGEQLDITTKIPGTGEERDFSVDLRQILNKLVVSDFDGDLDVNNMHVKIRPLTYREFTKSSMKTFEEQRIFQLVNNQEIPEEEKLAKFNESFRKLTDLTVDMMNHSVYSITVDGSEVTNPTHLQEFMQNADKEFFNQLQAHLEVQKEKFQIEPLHVTTTDEDREKGAPDSFDIPITFDQSNFFA